MNSVLNMVEKPVSIFDNHMIERQFTRHFGTGIDARRVHLLLPFPHMIGCGTRNAMQAYVDLSGVSGGGGITPRLISALYVEAMVLADEVRGYFDEAGRDERDALPPLQRVGFSCESLKVTTRLMHIIAWLLTQRAVYNGEIAIEESLQPARRLGDAAPSDARVSEMLPARARALIHTSCDLYDRVARLDSGLLIANPPVSPVRQLMGWLESVY